MKSIHGKVKEGGVRDALSKKVKKVPAKNEEAGGED